MWQTIRELVAGGTTVLLTTQYLDEADQLADEIVVLAGGVIAAAGTPAELTAAAGLARIRVSLPTAGPAQVRAAAAALGPGAQARGRTVTVAAPDGLASLASAVQRLAASNVQVHDAGLEQPTLDEVFAALTGGNPAPEAAHARADDTGRPNHAGRPTDARRLDDAGRLEATPS
jgi:ABC-2 type transport system ATP-binding protein